MNVPFETVNILEDDRLRTGMKAYSQWPTFPQIYMNGERGVGRLRSTEREGRDSIA